MAHIYLTFDFGSDEEKAQLARHKIEGWKQAFRLDKKLTYKFERPPDASADGTASPGEASEAEARPARKQTGKKEKSAKAGKAAKAEKDKKTQNDESGDESEAAAAAATGPVKLLVRLAFSGHEKMTEERWVKRIPNEEPFAGVSPKIVKSNDGDFGEVESRFEALE